MVSQECCSGVIDDTETKAAKACAKAGGLKKGTEPSCIGIDDFANQPTPRTKRRWFWDGFLGFFSRTGRMRCKQYFFENVTS